MGVPPEIEYGNDCLPCWLAGKTPKYLYLKMTGIFISPLWNPVFDPPPNGVWRLTQTAAPCLWTAADGQLNFIFQAAPWPGYISVPHFGGFSAFESGNLAICTFFADSVLIPPPLRIFNWGKALIAEVP